MPARKRNLIAIALGAALMAPMAFAQSGQAVPATKAPPVASASDAVSANTTMRESGRMNDKPVADLATDATVGASGNSPPGKGNWWTEADIDGDGKLSHAEAQVNAGLDARFGNIDGDADGYVSLEEYRKFYTAAQSQGESKARAHSAVVTRDVWTRLDANSDGKLSSTEVSSNTSVSGAFAVMDGNGDGFVTQAEYTAYARKNM